MIAEQADMRVPSELIPRCPKYGKPQTPNLRCDDSFVQDEGWYTAAQRYEDFLHRHRNGHILFLELGVGGNTPGIIKVPFLRMAAQNPKATYACINLGEAITTKELETQSILLDADIGAVLSDLLICVPGIELVEQWEADVSAFFSDITIIQCSSLHPNWKQLLLALIQAKIPKRTVVISTYDSAISDFSMDKWKSIPF